MPLSVEKTLAEDLLVIARRENKSRSLYAEEILAEHVKNHKAGNSTYTLDNWRNAPAMRGFPTPWGGLKKVQLAEYSVEELDAMAKDLEHGKETVVAARKDAKDKELRAKGWIK